MHDPYTSNVTHHALLSRVVIHPRAMLAAVRAPPYCAPHNGAHRCSRSLERRGRVVFGVEGGRPGSLEGGQPWSIEVRGQSWPEEARLGGETAANSTREWSCTLEQCSLLFVRRRTVHTRGV